MFRAELYDQLSHTRLMTSSRSISVKIHKRVVTDIDAMIFDPIFMTVGLFQLKFQDIFGRSLRQRSNRRTDMLKANEWVSTVTEWLSKTPERDLQQVLGLPKGGLNKERIKLFVIGRNAAHFAGNDYPDSRAAWGIWPQLKRIIVNANYTEDFVNYLFEKLKEESPYNERIEQSGREEIWIAGRAIVITTENTD